MRINNNLMAFNTHRQFTINNESVASTTEKLSSGFKINRAGDDAAGLAISEKMRAQIRGLEMAAKNSQDAISLVQTAEGALTETHAILQKMRELAVQSGSDTNQTADINDANTIDREALNAEFQQLMDEIDDIAEKAKFNNIDLLNGKLVGEVSDGEGAVEGEITATIDSSKLNTSGSNVASATVSFGDDIELEDGNNNFTLVYTSADEGTLTLTRGGNTIGTVTNVDAHSANELVFGSGDDAVTITLTKDDDEEAYNLAEIDTSIEFAASAGGGSEATSGGLVIQTGANEGDVLNIQIDDMRAEALQLRGAAGEGEKGAGISIATGDDARSAITKVNNAINKVSTQRSKLGAYQNRLEHKINNLNTSAENLQAAESRIRDLDMAKEMTAFTRNSILVQASTAMLAQANNAPQVVLSLLR